MAKCVWRLAGPDAALVEAELNQWLLDNGGYQLIPLAVGGGLERGKIGDFWRKLEPAINTTAAVVSLWAYFAAAPSAPDFAERQILLTQARALAAEVERLQCQRDFSLELIDTDTGRALSAAQIHELLDVLCPLGEAP